MFFYFHLQVCRLFLMSIFLESVLQSSAVIQLNKAYLPPDHLNKYICMPGRRRNKGCWISWQRTLLKKKRRKLFCDNECCWDSVRSWSLAGSGWIPIPNCCECSFAPISYDADPLGTGLLDPSQAHWNSRKVWLDWTKARPGARKLRRP